MKFFINPRSIIAVTDHGVADVEVRLVDGSRWWVRGKRTQDVLEERDLLPAERMS